MWAPFLFRETAPKVMELINTLKAKKRNRANGINRTMFFSVGVTNFYFKHMQKATKCKTPARKECCLKMSVLIKTEY